MSITSLGLMVFANKLSDIIPRDPFLRNSSPSSAIDNSSYDNSGVAKTTDLNSPYPLLEKNVTLNVDVSLGPTVSDFG